MIITTLISIAIVALAIGIYLATHRMKSRRIHKKIEKAKLSGLHEPVHIHPLIDPSKCIGSGACVGACPEKDILGLADGKGKLVKASNCIGHGACAEACPVGAITLVFGTAKRGVDIPYISPHFETNLNGVFIVGELGGMGLIRNAITQGTEAMKYISSILKKERRGSQACYDVVIVGAGPAGLGASLMAKQEKLKFVTIDQGDIGGTVFNYPKKKIIMTSHVNLPLHGKVRLKETTKEALLSLWLSVLNKTELKINSHEKMTALTGRDGDFTVVTPKAEYTTKKVILAIGRRGTPRKLGVKGEALEKVAYSLLDAEQHKNENLLVVGGGDSAVEAAIALSEEAGNKVTLSYRGEAFNRIKKTNRKRLEDALKIGALKAIYNSNLKEIREKEVTISIGDTQDVLPNNFVYIFAGGELPNDFLKSIGIQIEKKFGTR